MGPVSHFYISRVPTDRLLESSLAVTYATIGNVRSLSRVGKGDRLLLYVTRVGVIASGTVQSPWDGREHKVPRSLETEYRLSVKWRQLAKPLSPAQVIERFNYVPVRVLQRISLALADVERLLTRG